MKRQSGTFIMALAAGLVVGGAAGGFAWYQTQKLMHVRGELAETQASLQTATASANAARTQLLAVRKELDEQRMAAEQLRADRDSARALLDAEKAHTERVRAELNLARQQLAFVRARQLPAYAAPIQPQIIRVVPATSRPQAVGVGAPPAIQGQRPTPSR